MDEGIALSVSWKLSNLLVQESVSLLGLEDKLECIESKLREIVHGGRLSGGKRSLRDIAYDIEEVIDALVTKAAQQRARGILMRYVLAFFDFIDQHKLRRKLDQIRIDIFEKNVPTSTVQSGTFDYFTNGLEVGDTIISPVVRKVTALLSQEQLSPAVKRQARWLRDELTSLDPAIKRLESEELREPEMAWMEEVCDVSRSAEDVIGLFLYEREQLRRSWKGPFKDLVLALHNFKSQSKLRHEMDRINSKVQELSKSKGQQLRSVHTRKAKLHWGVHEGSSSRGMDIAEQPGITGLRRIVVRTTSLPSFNYEQPQQPDITDDTIGAESFSSKDEQPRQPDVATIDDNASATLSSSCNAKQPDATGFGDDVDNIMEVLLKDDLNCLNISIAGMKGTGKRRLAKLIYENDAVRDHFPYRAWVCRGYMEFFMKEILGAEYSKIEYVDGEAYDGYLCRLRQKFIDFMKDKKHLIVFEDAYMISLSNEDEIFQDLSDGTRILILEDEVGVTPQRKEGKFTYRLHLRSDEESWALFTCALKVNITPELLKQKREIVRRCGGLPLVIEKLGGILSEKDATSEEWSRVIEQLNQDEEPWLGTLYEINKNLPLYLRRCLFYFGLFPADFDIPSRRLIGLWVAEGLGREKCDEEPPERVAEKCLIELVNRNMIQVTEKKLNGKIKKCRLPDALRVHWLSKANEASFLQDNSSSSGATSMGVIRRLADHLDQRDPSFNDIHGNNSTSSLGSRYGDVVSFLSFDVVEEGRRPGEDIGNFLDQCISSNGFHYLWVLDLEGVYKPKLPTAVAQLSRLRYLGLRSTFLEMLPLLINKLLNLQTLDLKRTHISTLPNSIWKMQKLRHLFLDESHHRELAPKSKGSSLVELQTLWGVVVNEKSPVRNGLDTLLNITKLAIACKISKSSQKEAMSSQLDAVANWILNLKHLQSLRVKSLDDLSQPSDLHLEPLSGHIDLSSIYLVGKLKNQYLVSEFPHSLIELTLSASGLTEDPMQTLDNLPNLRIVRLFSGSFAGKKMLCSSRGFPKLQILKFWELELLEEWNVEEGALPSLRDLEIRSCRNLKMLPDGLRYVRTLREFKLSKLPKLSARIKDNQDWDKIAHVRHVYTED